MPAEPAAVVETAGLLMDIFDSSGDGRDMDFFTLSAVYRFAIGVAPFDVAEDVWIPHRIAGSSSSSVGFKRYRRFASSAHKERARTRREKRSW
jgi:hypothetical protein